MFHIFVFTLTGVVCLGRLTSRWEAIEAVTMLKKLDAVQDAYYLHIAAQLTGLETAAVMRSKGELAALDDYSIPLAHPPGEHHEVA